MTGKLYGVGVGPGDPEMLTLKAVRIINECEVIGIPSADAAKCTALSIVRDVVRDVDKKKIVSVAVPMTTDKKRLRAAYEQGVLKLSKYLDEGKSVAFLNLGDPTVYGSYMTIHSKLKELGYDAEVINGVTSFSAVGGVLDMPIGSRSGAVHIIPGCYGGPDDEKVMTGYIDKRDTLVFMKSGSGMADIKDRLRRLSERYPDLLVKAVTDCGMETQSVADSLEEIADNCGYYTTIIAERPERL